MWNSYIKVYPYLTGILKSQCCWSKLKMAVDYASGLSDYPHKGKCGAPEVCSVTLILMNIVVQRVHV